MSEDHLRWISCVFDRILDAASINPTKPMLCLSFAQKIPNNYALTKIPRDINLKELSKGVHYAVILYLLRENNFLMSDPRALFTSILANLRILGYTPKPPCDPANLTRGEVTDHTNLCICLESAIFDRSMSIEHLLDDLKRLPRSFFVLREYPGHIDDAIKLWLNKFHCVIDLFELNDVQRDMNTFSHFAAVLSRMFPSRIRRAELKKTRELTPEEIEINKRNSFSILNEVGAFMPAKFPVDSALFRVAIADLYYATKPAAQKFVKVAAPVPVVGIRPASAKLPAIERKTKSKRMVVMPSPRRSAKKVTIAASPRRKSEAEELLEIYNFMSTGERKERFRPVDDAKQLIDVLVKMMDMKESEQTFSRLGSELAGKAEANTHLQNGIAFLWGLSGNNNEFQASRKAVFFARRMVKTQGSMRPMTAAPPKIIRRGKPHRPAAPMRMLASIATQTASMTQTVSAVRDPVPLPVPIALAAAEKLELGTQTEKMIAQVIQKHYDGVKRSSARPLTANTFSTVSFPYGAEISGFAPKRGRQEPMSARRLKVL